MIIDADVHIAPKNLFDKLQNKEFVDAYKKNNESFFVSQIDAYDWSAKNRYWVDRQLLNFYGPTCGLSYCLPNESAVDVMRTYNDFMIKLSKSYKKFDVNLWLAMQNPQACVEEIDRLDTESYFGVHVGDQIPWGFMPKYDVLFELLNKKNIPLYVHFSGHDDAPKLWFENLPTIYHDFKKIWSNPVIDDQKLVMLSLIVETLPRFPDLKIVIAEHGIDWIKDFCKEIQEYGLADPLAILQRNFWFTCEPEDPTFLQDAAFVGWNRLLFATDAPHDDIGGKNADNDVTLVNDFLINKLIDNQDFKNFTESNYLQLFERSKICS